MIDIDVFERTLPDWQRWENLTLANDFMFGAVFSDEGVCLDLIRIIFPELDIERISFQEKQKTERHTLDTKGVRFDVYLRDDKGRIINIEIQVENQHDLPRRTRAYHAMMDLDALERKSAKLYNNMPEAIVIFICAFDPFGLKRHVYTFRNMCLEERELALDDGASTVFLNTKGRDKEVSPKVKAFLELLEGRSSDDEFVRRLEERMKYAKQDRFLRRKYLMSKFERNERIAEGRAEGIAIGRAEGEQKASIRIARRMRSIGMNDQQIQAVTGLPLEVISSLQHEV